jgi:hypothetical protein
MRTCGALLFLVAARVLAGAAPSAVDDTRVWPADALVKVFPADAPPDGLRPGSPFELWAVRNQHVSFQVAFRSSRRLKAVTARCPAPGLGSGASITNVQVRAVAYGVVSMPTADLPADERVGQAPGWYPDALLDFPIDCDSNRTHAVWVSAHVPADAAPGGYAGRVTIEVSGQTVAEVPFQITVLKGQVPARPTLKVTNWLNWSGEELRRHFGVEHDSPGWWELVGNFARVLGDYRQNVILTPLADLTRAHVESGRLLFDFDRFDRWVRTFRDRGGFEFIEGPHLLGRTGGYDGPLEASVFVADQGRARMVALPPEDPRVEPALVAWLEALNAHLDARGWKAMYLQHILDEPHGQEPPHYARFAQLVRRHLPGVRTIDAIDLPDPDKVPRQVLDYCDIWVPQLGRFDAAQDFLRRRAQDGLEVWFYTCLYPRGRHLNRLIDQPLLKTRLLHWANFSLGMTGFLHWGGNFWTPDPIHNTQPVINSNSTWLPAGDAFIVYPDRARRSLHSSIRLEAMRDGIEDYELLRSLTERDPAAARRIADAVVPTLTGYVRDVALFRRSHRELLEAVSR